jgi:hypothetical protein
MGNGHGSRGHLHLVADNTRSVDPSDEDSLLLAFCESQARWLKTGRKHDGEAARIAYHEFSAATGCNPRASAPLHGWEYVP